MSGGTRTPALMFQGTGSDVGKSLLVAGFCRLFTRRGLRVRPFKPQNMSNNAAVTPDGGEIGRAQALQARACGIATSRHMNPVLLKPQTDVGAQVVVQGTVLANAGARDYFRLKPSLLPKVLESYAALAAEADLVLVEGAGSAAEVNLRAADIANMGFAEAADLPVVLVGDIDRGGVLAQIVGTHALLPAAERARVVGYLVNKFRGDPSLFTPALDIIGGHTGWPSLGVLPWFARAADLPAEDAMALDQRRDGPAGGEGRVKVAVLRLSRIANFDDFDPLAAEPEVALTWVQPGRAIPGDADVVILPGSKATLADLAFLRAQGWDVDLAAHLRRGGRVIGICAGYQMLGRVVRDPEGIEGPPGEAAGLGLLDVETVMRGPKTLREAAGTEVGSGLAVAGYEMHMGKTAGPDRDRPWLHLGDGPDGAVSADGRVRGCYLHGLFAADAFRRAVLGLDGAPVAYEAGVDAALDALADHLEAHADLPALERAAGL
ncbi:adenosylcobyric acid synthase (glutamine-hydrolysing) [Caenispirillum bisanense]|uniref:Cobyric acid synthase n=2 Tax=Caenispirillum bisanense TaxID=414052 RepID=A0A286GHX8_9PROT|nr:adenosylcobyric acid synthase (glutamine-hydrolysing) [Caenispirillum bisanense]